MLRLGKSAASEASTCGGLMVSAIRSSLEAQLQQRGLRALQCAYQTQSRRNPEPGSKRGRNPLSLAVVGAAALSVGLELQAESVAHARAAIEPAAHQHKHKWQLFDQIGAGAFGIVRIGMHEDSGEVAAVKIVPMENPNDQRSYPSLEREISALKLVKALGGHKSIIDLRDVYVEGRKLFLVTELARGGELFEQIVAYGSFPESKARDVAREIASALSFLHRHGLVHKDVKPENILLSARVVEPGGVPPARAADDGRVHQCVRYVGAGLRAVHHAERLAPVRPGRHGPGPRGGAAHQVGADHLRLQRLGHRVHGRQGPHLQAAGQGPGAASHGGPGAAAPVDERQRRSHRHVAWPLTASRWAAAADEPCLKPQLASVYNGKLQLRI
jgi:hypothetical protein